ncbi:MAG: hypothetical protein HQK69_07555, partial [Desulfamplus sp.]|nr:hypothetical protein [Desulfamplus sp.]
ICNKIVRFIPENYSVLNMTKGDLNLDSIDDIILILKKNGEEKTSDVIEHPEKRPLYILIGKSDGLYELAAKNDNAVYCVDCGGMLGDPFNNITIKKGCFSVEHFGGSAWRWTRIITFKYSKSEKNWFLHKDGGDSFHAAGGKVETRVKTVKDFGLVMFEQYDIYKK